MIDLDQIERLTEAADGEERWITRPKRDFDYISFGPVYNLKDNGEGSTSVYAFVAKMTPSVVLELVRLARGQR